MKRNQEYLKHLTEIVKADMEKYHVPYVDVDFFLNPRLSSSLGRCIYKEKTVVRLELQSKFFLLGNESDIKNTICHELIHSSTLCGHTGLWLQYAKIMNKHGYDIHRTSRVDIHPQIYKYEVYCPKCGKTWKRKTLSKAVKFPYTYQCPVCKIPLKSRACNNDTTL